MLIYGVFTIYCVVNMTNDELAEILGKYQNEVSTITNILKDFVPLTVEEFDLIKKEFRKLNERCIKIESLLEIAQKDTKLIPGILSILNEDGHEFVKIQDRLQKLEN